MQDKKILDNYFNSYKQYIYYYDAMIKKSNYTKEYILKYLNISYMSYSRVKNSNTKINREIIYKLEKYFGINPIKQERQEDYEKLINDFLVKFYYKGDGILEYMDAFKQCISEHNYLQPIFEMLILLIQLTSEQSYMTFFDNTKKKFDELRLFSEGYLLPPFKGIYIMIEVVFNKNKLATLKIPKSYSNNMIGLIYNSYCSNAYLAKKFELSLYYANECRKCLIDDYNFNRLITVNLTYFLCLNIIGDYEKCKKESYKQLLYLKEVKKNLNLIYLTVMHYYTALLGLAEFDQLINILDNAEAYTSNDFIFLLIASKESNQKKYEGIKILYESQELMFNNKQNEYIHLIIEYLENKKNIKLKNKIMNSELNEGLKKILLKSI